MVLTYEFFSAVFLHHDRKAARLHAKFLTREVTGWNEQSCFNLKISASVKHINEQVRQSRAFKYFSKIFNPWSLLWMRPARPPPRTRSTRWPRSYPRPPRASCGPQRRCWKFWGRYNRDSHCIKFENQTFHSILVILQMNWTVKCGNCFLGAPLMCQPCCLVPHYQGMLGGLTKTVDGTYCTGVSI